jgi:hypothetical protein
MRMRRTLEDGREQHEGETCRGGFVVRPECSEIHVKFRLGRIQQAELVGKTVAGQKLPVGWTARIQVTEDVIRIAERGRCKQPAEPLVQREQHPVAIVDRGEVMAREQGGNRAGEAGAKTLAALLRRQMIQVRSEEVCIDLAAIVFEQRERADQPERGDVVLFRIDELLELIERKGKCHDVDSLKIGMTNNIEMMSSQNRIIAVGSYQICPGRDFGNFLCRSLACRP